MMNIEVLIRKGLYEKALEYIQTTRKFAFEREFWGCVIDLIEMERNVYNTNPKDDAIKFLEQINSEKAEVIDRIKKEQEYNCLAQKFKSIKFNYGKSKPSMELKKFNQLLKVKLFDQENVDNSIYVKIL